jgi:uncharacterized membrane protein YdjX (TVP38/TMEM64 family)
MLTVYRHRRCLVGGVAWLFDFLLHRLLAATTTFFLGRAVKGGRIGAFVRQFRFVRRAESLMSSIVNAGWISILAIQTNPLVPASSAGYAFGYCGTRAPFFIALTYCAMLPLQLVLVKTGAAATEAASLSASKQDVTHLMLWLSIALAVIAVMRIVQSRGWFGSVKNPQ